MADIKELMQVRRDKMQKLIDNGVNVHPERYERTHQIKEARELPDGTKDVSIAGRVMSKRKLGKIYMQKVKYIKKLIKSRITSKFLQHEKLIRKGKNV